MKITFLGGGNMANALIGGLLQQGTAPADIQVIEVDGDARQRLSLTHGVSCHASLDAWDPVCDVVMLAVKPQQMKAAVAPMIPKLASQLIVSIAAGLRIGALSRWLGGYGRIVRCMPNTPAMIGAGITGLFAAPEVTEAERRSAERVLQAAGSTVWVDDEARLDAVTAVSGSGPAYVFLFIEALQEAGAKLGFTPEQARQLAIETVLGAAQLASRSPDPAATLRERVTSKAGTTEAALRVMAEKGVKEGIIAGILAANARSIELGDLLGAD